MVGLELHLVPVLGDAAILEDHAGVVDEDVEPVVRSRENSSANVTHGRERREVEGHHLARAAAPGLDLRFARSRPAFSVAGRDHDAGTVVRERDRSLEPDARVAAGDAHDLAVGSPRPRHANERGRGLTLGETRRVPENGCAPRDAASGFGALLGAR